MIANFTSKGIALAAISVLTAGLIASGTVVTEAFLFRMKEAGAAVEAAQAEIQKANAEMQKAIAEKFSAEASKLDAENKLLAAIESRNAVTQSANTLGAAQERSAEIAGQALMRATEIDRHVDNAIFDRFTVNLLPPTNEITSLNKKITYLKGEAETGIDQKTRRVLSETERADRMAEARILESDKALEKETASANMGDTIALMVDGVTRGLGNLGSAFPTGHEPAPVRRIVVDR